MSSTIPLVWLITGTSTGIGRELAEAALSRGDKVIATARARSFARLEDLKAKGAAAIELDVTAPQEQLDQVAKKAIEIYGHVDVVVNNAGYILAGAIEENTSQETYDQFNTNVFGGINVARAFLPYMRKRRTGTIIWIGSIGGWKGLANCGLYCATKFALRGVSESLHQEISPLGLRSICIDFGYTRTSFLNDGNRQPRISRIDDYRPIIEAIEALFEKANNNQPGDPTKGAKVIVDLAHGDGPFKEKQFPTSLILGSDAYEWVGTATKENIKEIVDWKEVTISTDF